MLRELWAVWLGILCAKHRLGEQGLLTFELNLRITRISPHFGPDPESVCDLADRLAAAKNPLIVAGDAVGLAGTWAELRDLAHATGAPVL